MRKILCIISVALLALTACTSSDDNPATSDLGVKEKIMGKWIEVEIDGQPAPTRVSSSRRTTARACSRRCRGPT